MIVAVNQVQLRSQRSSSLQLGLACRYTKDLHNDLMGCCCRTIVRHFSPSNKLKANFPEAVLTDFISYYVVWRLCQASELLPEKVQT